MALVLLIFFIRAFAASKAHASWQAGLWILLTIRLALPWISPWLSLPGLPLPGIHISIPAAHKVQFSLFILWMAGILALGIRIALENLRLATAIRKGRVLTSQPILELLEACKKAMDVTTPMVIILSDRAISPALFGLLRPRLLLHPDVLEHLSEEELKCIFMHELAHLKRLDLLWAWLSTFIQLVHWFNPLVWLAFRHMRNDRELACDESAIAALKPEEAVKYGQTLIKLMEYTESIQRPIQPSPILAGIAETHFSRRIHMILNSAHANNNNTKSAKNLRGRWSLPSMLLMGTVTVLAFGLRLQAKEMPQANEPAPLSTPMVDKIDYPFVNDPELVSGWRSVDFVKNIDQFQPGKPVFKKELYLKELFFKANGKTNMAITWTKGHLLHSQDKTDSRYEIRTIEDKQYLFFQWKNGDYKKYGVIPGYYVMEKEPNMREVVSSTCDKIDYPFQNDPAVIGHWRSVDFVKSPELFHPNKKTVNEELYLKALNVLPDGKVEAPWTFTWTSGLFLHAGDKTASRYQIRKIQEKEYLFLEWKSGDYTKHGMQPQWYVLARQ